jgi:cytidyltransferase-like protein
MGEKIDLFKVWVNGTFDILHRGHLELLEYAYSFGEVRVGIDTDERVKELKGNDRPFNTYEDRSYFMSRINGVSSVVSFSSNEELCDRIKEWEPDYLIVGSDYKNKEVIGSQFAKEIIYFDRIGDYSTTKILSNESVSDR